MPSSSNKSKIFDWVEEDLKSRNIKIVRKDKTRPWGGFFVIDNSSLSVFINNFFPNTNFVTDDANFSYSPKILIVEPGKRLSWQYHHRRSEHWRIIEGPVGVIISNTNEQTPMIELFSGDKISIERGQRHRLIGLYDWTVVAEIWQHQDPQNPSDENDIIRVEDDFNRENSE